MPSAETMIIDYALPNGAGSIGLCRRHDREYRESRTYPFSVSDDPRVEVGWHHSDASCDACADAAGTEGTVEISLPREAR